MSTPSPEKPYDQWLAEKHRKLESDRNIRRNLVTQMDDINNRISDTENLLRTRVVVSLDGATVAWISVIVFVAILVVRAVFG